MSYGRRGSRRCTTPSLAWGIVWSLRRRNMRGPMPAPAAGADEGGTGREGPCRQDAKRCKRDAKARLQLTRTLCVIPVRFARWICRLSSPSDVSL